MSSEFIEENRPVAASDRLRRFGYLVVVTSAMGFVWLIVLPLIGRQPSVSEHIATQQRLGIDPSALFYTELQNSSGIARHAERLQGTYSSEFWSISKAIRPVKSINATRSE